MGKDEPVNATWTILKGFLRDAVGQVQKACRGWDSDQGFCLWTPPHHGCVDAGPEKACL